MLTCTARGKVMTVTRSTQLRMAAARARAQGRWCTGARSRQTSHRGPATRLLASPSTAMVTWTNQR